MIRRQNARALRVIGQNLAALGVNHFELGKSGDQYSVAFNTRELVPARNFLSRLFGTSDGGDGKSRRAKSKTLRFSITELMWADVARSISRSDVRTQTDFEELSLLLRALGDFLDDQDAHEFWVSWHRDQITVRFEDREKKFRPLNLYDRGTHMYLRRAERHRL
jgi:hypothetical protein